VATWFASQEGGDDDIPDAPEDDEPEVEPQQPGGARTLGGDGIPSRYVPPTANTTLSGSGSSSRQAAPARRGGQPAGRGAGAARTLRDLQGGGEHAGHGHDDDDDDDDEQQNFFTGGEKSGLAVQNPNAGGGDRNNPRDQIESMLDKARRCIFTRHHVTIQGEG
jgi:UBX domain-containing protein 1